MIGLVLWFNSDPGSGIVWCEDQGPLAFIAPEASLPRGVRRLDCGDQLVFSFEVRDGVRYVRDVYSVTSGVAGRDPAAILSGYHETRDVERHLRVVA